MLFIKSIQEKLGMRDTPARTFKLLTATYDSMLFEGRFTHVRERLGSLLNSSAPHTQWTASETSKAAVALADSIDFVLNTGLGLNLGEEQEFSWLPEVRSYANIASRSPRQGIAAENELGVHLQILSASKSEPGGVWTTNAPQLEATLSLWLYMAKMSEKKNQKPFRL